MVLHAGGDSSSGGIDNKRSHQLRLQHPCYDGTSGFEINCSGSNERTTSTFYFSYQNPTSMQGKVIHS